MYNPTPPLAAEIELLKAAYDALNRNDVAGFVEIFDPQVERTEPADLPGGGVHRGLEAVKAHVSLRRGQWAEGCCEPEHFVAAGDRIVVLVHVRVRLENEVEWREGRIADVYTFRGGKAIQSRTFVDRREALEWAGVDAPDAS